MLTSASMVNFSTLLLTVSDTQGTCDLKHYSAAELRELIDAMEFIAPDNARESHALMLLKRKAG